MAEMHDQLIDETPAARSDEQTGDAPVSDDALLDVELQLRFEVGTAKATVREITSLQPGYVFTTETAITSPVTIAIDGVTLGRGELLQIGDRIGIRVTEYNGHE